MNRDFVAIYFVNYRSVAIPLCSIAVASSSLTACCSRHAAPGIILPEEIRVICGLNFAACWLGEGEPM